jgi:hypothetical protein
MFGPTDWAEAYASWRSAIAQGSPLAGNYQLLKSALDQASTERKVRRDGAKRSPVLSRTRAGACAR